MSSNKAMATTSLSWMIMTIIGAFFIIFAYSLIQNYQDIEEEKFELELQSTLNHIFTLIGQSTGSESSSLQKLNTIFEDRKIEMFCREGIPTLSIDGDENPNADFLKNYPVFMTEIEQEKVDESYIAVQNFELPFRITPLLAIVSKKNLYVIDSSQTEFEELFRTKFSQYSAFNELNVKFINFSEGGELSVLLDEIDEQNLNSVTLMSSQEYDLNSFLEELSIYGSYVHVQYESFEIDDQKHYKGVIRYLNSTNPQEEFPKEFSFIDWNEGFALPTMALFSKSSIFECSYTTLKNSINQTYHYYEKKAEQLEKISSTTQHCKDSISLPEQQIYYGSLIDTLQQARNSETFMNMQEPDTLRTLQERHDRVVQNSCIYLY